MTNELASIIVAGITALAALLVAYVNRSGNKMVDRKQPPPDPNESGDHAHTRDLLKGECRLLRSELRDGIKGLHRRFDTVERTRGLERQSSQIGASSRRVEQDRRKGGKSEPDK